MAENSKIEWTKHTVNFWWGCTHYGPDCNNCYAETLANRFGVPWGKGAPRKERIDKAIAECVKLNRKAAAAGRIDNVFTNSMSDFLDSEVPDEWRMRALGAMRQCQNLFFQVLTKRAENIAKVQWPDNAFVGFSAGNQETFDRRWAHAKEAGILLWLSAEPLIGPIDIGNAVGIDWVVVGGESGPKARPMHPDWARSLRDQCVAAGVPFFFKQHGEWKHLSQCIHEDPDYILHCRAFWHSEDVNDESYFVGKKAAGRLLDGREWNQIPERTNDAR